jgi:predicted ATP-grasp superfamily ATP-dependent carboligase
VLFRSVSAGGLRGDPAEAELLPLGRSMRDAMMHELLALPPTRLRGLGVAACDAAPLPDGLARDPRLRVLRPAPGGDLLAFIATQARGHDAAWIVAPETGGLLQACEAAVRGAAGGRAWLGSSADAMAVAASKTRTLAALAKEGVATPLDADWATVARRWVVKPDDGAGAVATEVLADRAAAKALAQRRRAAGEAVTLQPWVEGEALSVSLLCGRRPGEAAPRAELLSLNRQHIAIEGAQWMDGVGSVRFAGVESLCTDGSDPRWSRLQALADAVQRALPGLFGFVGVDLVWHPQAGPVAIEVNARVSCAFVGLGQRLGRSLAGEILAMREAAWPPEGESFDGGE